MAVGKIRRTHLPRQSAKRFAVFPELVRAEAEKALTPFTIGLLAVLLLIEVCFTVFSFMDTFGADGKEIRAAREKLLTMYNESRGEYEELSADFDRREREYEAGMYRQMADDRSLPIFENKLIDLDGYGDRQLFSDVRKAIAAPADFRETLRGTLVDAAARLRESDSEDGYLYEYYLNILTIYDRLVEMELPVIFADGWKELFDYQAPMIFIALACLAVFSRTFTLERGCGTDRLLRVSRLGGSCTDAAKLAFTAIFSIFVTLLFSLIPFALFLLSGGLSAVESPIQCVSGMTFCPLQFSIGQYFAIFLVVRAAAFMCFSLIISASGRLSGASVTGFAVTILLAGIGLYLESIPPSSYLYPLSGYSPLALVKVMPLFDRYHGADIFGKCVSRTSVLLFLAAALTVIACAAVLLCGAGRGVNVCRKNASGRTVRTYSLSLFRQELYKISASGVWICVAAAFLVKCFLTVAYFIPPKSSDEAVFREYMERFLGEITEEKLLEIENERVYIETTLAEYQSILTRYRAGELSGEEYGDFISRYNYAKYCDNACKRLIERRDSLIAASEDHSGVRFFYDRGVRLFVTSFPDAAALFCLIVLTGQIFSVEKGETASSGFSFILRASRRGRREAFFTKYLTAVFLTAAVYVLFTGVDIIAAAVFYGFRISETVSRVFRRSFHRAI